MRFDIKLPTLTKEQAKAVEFVIQHSEEDYVLGVIADPKNNLTGDFRILNGIPIRTLSLAFYVGFNVEPEPEVAILNEYKRACEDVSSGDYDKIFEGQARKETIEFMLRQLGKKIEGIN